MEINKVVETLLKIVGTDAVGFISGKIISPGVSGLTKLEEGRGSVYGLAVFIEKTEDLQKIYEDIPLEHKNSTKLDDWKSIGDNYYPLYWGRDINFGARLYSHTKTVASTGTIQIDSINALKDKTIIYGAIPCINQAKHESRVRETYKDILKTIKGTKKDKTEEDFIRNLSQDEQHDF